MPPKRRRKGKCPPPPPLPPCIGRRRGKCDGIDKYDAQWDKGAQHDKYDAQWDKGGAQHDKYDAQWDKGGAQRGDDAQLAEVSAVHAQRWRNTFGEGQTTKWSGAEENDAARHAKYDSQWERHDGHECDADRHDKGTQWDPSCTSHKVQGHYRAKRRRTCSASSRVEREEPASSHAGNEDDDVLTRCPTFGWLTQSEVQRQIDELNDMTERYIEDQKRERERDHEHASASTRTCKGNNEGDPTNVIEGETDCVKQKKTNNTDCTGNDNTEGDASKGTGKGNTEGGASKGNAEGNAKKENDCVKKKKKTDCTGNDNIQGTRSRARAMTTRGGREQGQGQGQQRWGTRARAMPRTSSSP